MASSVFSKLLLIKVWGKGEFSALLIVSVFPQILFLFMSLSFVCYRSVFNIRNFPLHLAIFACSS